MIYGDHYGNVLFGNQSVPTVADLRRRIEGLRRIADEKKEYQEDALRLIEENEAKIIASAEYYAKRRGRGD
jgi:hypothetical protein